MRRHNGTRRAAMVVDEDDAWSDEEEGGSEAEGEAGSAMTVGRSVFPQSVRVGGPSAPRPFRPPRDTDEEEEEEEDEDGDEGGWGGPWPREDGTVAPRRPQRYGARWTRIVFRAQDILEADPYYQFLRQVAGSANTDVETLYQGEDVRQVAREASRVATEAEQGRVEALGRWEDFRDLEVLLERDIEGQGLHTDIETLHRAAQDMRAAAWVYEIERRWKPEVYRPYVGAATPDGEVAPARAALGDLPTGGEFAAAMGRATEGWAVLMLDTERLEWAENVALAWLRDRLEDEAAALANGPGGGRGGAEVRTLTRIREAVANTLQGLREHRRGTARVRKRNRGAYEAVLFVLAVLSVSWERAVRGLPAVKGALQGAGSLGGDEIYAVLGGGERVTTPEGEPSGDWDLLPGEVWYGWAKRVLGALDMAGARTAVMRDSYEYQWLHSLATLPATGAEVRRRNEYAAELLGAATEAFGEARETALEVDAEGIADAIPPPEEGREGGARAVRSSRQSAREQLSAAARALASFLDREPLGIDTFLEPHEGGARPAPGPGGRAPEKGKEREGGSTVGPGEEGGSRADAVVRLTAEMREVLETIRDAVETLRSEIQGALKQLMPLLEEAADSPAERRILKSLLEEHARGVLEEQEQEQAAEARRLASGKRRRQGGRGASVPRPRPGWALRPMFTGRISLSAPALSALERAFGDVRHQLPGLAPRWMAADTVKRALIETPVLSQVFADLVAVHLLESSIYFPRQWMRDKALREAHHRHIGIVLRMSSWVWGTGAPYDTGELRAATRDDTRVAVTYSPVTGAPIPELPPPLHPAAPAEPPPDPLEAYSGEGERADLARRRGALATATAVLSAAQARLGGVRWRARPAPGQAQPPVAEARFRGGEARSGAGGVLGKRRRRPLQASSGIHAVCGQVLARWTPHDVRRIVLEAAKKTVYPRP